MVKFKCIIVDDEPIAIRIIKNHLSNFEEFEVIAECANAIEAMKALREEQVDLIFLDIEMPTLTGLELLKTQTNLPEVIFTTAHRNYAVDAFDVNALDYLLKPISFERFTKAINRFLDIQIKPHKPKNIKDETDWMMLKVDKKSLRINFSDISYIESMADYVIVHSMGKKLVTKERISQLEKKLPSELFLRVHRGFIINTKKIEAVYGSIVELFGVKIPIGRSYKEKVDRILIH